MLRSLGETCVQRSMSPADATLINTNVHVLLSVHSAFAPGQVIQREGQMDAGILDNLAECDRLCCVIKCVLRSLTPRRSVRKRYILPKFDNLLRTGGGV